MVKYVSIYSKGTHKNRSENDLSNDAYAMFFCAFVFLIFFIKAYVVGAHLNFIDKSLCLYTFIKKQTKSTLALI